MYSTISSSLFLFFLTFLFHSFPCVSSNPEWCDTRFQCGNITAGFPFWGENRPKHCNHLDLHCKNNITYLFVPYHRFTVLQINQTSNTLTLARENNLGSFCASKPVNKTLPTEQLELLSTYKRLTVYACLCHPPNFLYCTCPHIGSFFHNPNDHYFCNKSFEINVPQSFVPGEKELNLTHLESVLRKGFEVKVKIDEKDCEECSSSHELCDIKTLPLGAKCDPIHSPTQKACQKCLSANGTCGFDKSKQICCKEASPSGCTELLDIPTDEGLSTGVKACIAIAGVVVGVFILLAAALLYIARKRKKTQDARYTRKDLPITSYSSRETSRNPTSSTISSSINHSLLPSISNLANGNTYFGVQVFTYEELEEATANFSRELGDGGFGTVYYGVLKDGRSVAVKRLYERSLKRVEQFKNEIDILRSLKHPNLVILYGCTSRHSRELLLVYEYISNGTLADHLHGDRAESRPLCWSLRLKVAIETASALSFLHASGIIHRDVKTTNILLDENHQVKVADFGLSRLFPIDQTHISTAPQGTPGYVDPEYYQCYRLNEKSDVYSFGVVLTELISSKEAVDITRHRHDINLANMAVTKIQNNALHELVDPSLGFGKDPEIKRTMMAMAELAFRCLQQEREVRPSMDEIVEILKGIKMDNRVSSSPDVVDIERGGGDDIGLLRHSVPPPISPETDKWTSSSETAAST